MTTLELLLPIRTERHRGMVTTHAVFPDVSQLTRISREIANKFDLHFPQSQQYLHPTHAASALHLPQLLQTRDERPTHRCESKLDRRLAVLISAATVLRLHLPRARMMQ